MIDHPAPTDRIPRVFLPPPPAPAALHTTRHPGSIAARGIALRPAVLAALLAISACSEDSTTRPQIPEPSACGRIVVVTTDTQTGSVSVAEADSSFRVTPDVAAVHGDAVARAIDGAIYVVNRFGGDNIQILDPRNDFATVRQFSVGPGSNPQDIVVLSSTRAYVSRLGSESLLEVNPSTGETGPEISLATFADADGRPEMAGLVLLDGYLYIAIQRIDFDSGNFEPVAPSLLAVLDTRTNELVDVDPAEEGIQGIVLQGLNPIAQHREPESGELLVACVGIYGELDGGIERVDLVARRSLGWVAREAELGGDLIEFAFGPGTRAYATVSSPLFVTSLVAFDRTSGALLGTPYVSDGYELSDLIVIPCGQLVVCDRDYQAPGLRVFDAETGAPIEGIEQPISTGLPPFDLVFVEPPETR